MPQMYNNSTTPRILALMNELARAQTLMYLTEHKLQTLPSGQRLHSVHLLMSPPYAGQSIASSGITKTVGSSVGSNDGMIIGVVEETTEDSREGSKVACPTGSKLG